ncbi:MAG: mechanosensitive ion channel [Crocosphaera sp.]|nr:mechanosensitive ion channel [Crocosphaera sp.]
MNLNLNNIWNFTLFVIDQHPVTIGSSLIAVCVGLIFGRISNFIRLRIQKYLLKYTQVSPEGIFIIDKLLLIFNLLFTTIFVLQILHIPITELTVLGGSFAIAIGFAAKDIVSNTMSGFVMLLEQAIKVGDVIEIDDKIGKVKSIGIRSTIIHTAENIDIIMPNSNILQSQLINWTMENNQILTYIEVGVSYDTDVDHATDIMLQSVNNLNFIFRDPAPFVLFSNFGDSALIFQVYLMIKVSNKLQRLQQESKVRYQLFKDLKKAGIVIAFPQQDTHLDVPKTLDLRIVRNGNISDN